jgi:hypothetical protein
MIPVRLIAELVGAAVLIAALAGWWLEHNHHEQQVGAQKIEAQDHTASAAAERQADAGTEANIINAALAAKGATSAQSSVDAYLAAHPVGVIRLPDPAAAHDRGGRVCEAGPAQPRADSAGSGPAVVPAVPGGGEASDLGPATAEIVSSAARLAVIHQESQHR